MVVTNVLTEADFNTILNDWGRQVALVPITRAISNISGQESLTAGTPVIIEAYFMRSSQTWDFQGDGFVEKGAAVCLAKDDDAVEKDDLIYADGTYVSITAIEGDATTITITAVAHGLSAGDEICILGTTNYQGVFTITSAPDVDTLTITDATHDLDAETSGQIMKGFIKFRIKENFRVPGIFDNTGGQTQFIYSANNCFIQDGS